MQRRIRTTGMVLLVAAGLYAVFFVVIWLAWQMQANQITYFVEHHIPLEWRQEVLYQFGQGNPWVLAALAIPSVVILLALMVDAWRNAKQRRMLKERLG